MNKRSNFCFQGFISTCFLIEFDWEYGDEHLPKHAILKVAIKPLIVDGKIGKLTLAVFNNLPPAKLNAEINAEREASYRSDKDYAAWGKVWEQRLKPYA